MVTGTIRNQAPVLSTVMSTAEALKRTQPLKKAAAPTTAYVDSDTAVVLSIRAASDAMPWPTRRPHAAPNCTPCNGWKR